MSWIESAALLACSAAGCVALAALLRAGVWRGAWALTLLCAATAAWQGALAFRPAWWMPLPAGSAEAVLAWLTACVGVEALRHAGRFRPGPRAIVGRTALLLVCLLGVLGLVVSDLPAGLRVGYRGLLAVEAAAAVVLLVVRAGIAYYALEREPVADTALRWLGPYQVAVVVHVGLWEPAPVLARGLGVALALPCAWALLAVADAARQQPPAPRRGRGRGRRQRWRLATC